MKVITSTFYNRPYCAQQMLESLSRCDHINEYLLICFVEPGFPEVLEVLNKFKYHIEIHINSKLEGCWTNKKKAVARGFELCDYVIHIEDDIILSKDALVFFEWARNKYRGNEDIFSVTAFNKMLEKDYNDIKCHGCDTPILHHLVCKRQKYTSIAWATWRNRWLDFNEYWSGEDAELSTIYRTGRYELYPMLSRASHIGYSNGIRSHESLRKSVCEFLGRSDVYEGDLLINKDDREWIKLNSNNVKTKESVEFYKDHYLLDFWADVTDIPEFPFIDLGLI